MSLFSTIESALDALRNGGMIIAMDDEDRENEGDLIMAAECATPQNMGFFIRHTSGIICAPMKEEIADALELPPMAAKNTDPKGTAYCVSCDAKGTCTGVSGEDRALTMRKLGSVDSKPSHFTRPGHVFPLRAKPGGIFQRQGHTEASVDLCVLAGFRGVGVIGELTNKDGSMMRLEQCSKFAAKHHIPLITIHHFYQWRLQQIGNVGSTVRVAAECKLPITRNGRYLGTWSMLCYQDNKPDTTENTTHIALVLTKKGEELFSSRYDESQEALTVRIHSECKTGDLFGSNRCDCGEQLDEAFYRIHSAGSGVIIYVGGHEGRGIGLLNKIKAYQQMQASGEKLDTYEANALLGFPADMRSYDTPLAILCNLNIPSVRLLTNNPDKLIQLSSVLNVSHQPLLLLPNSHNSSYLLAKRQREKQIAFNSGVVIKIEQQNTLVHDNYDSDSKSYSNTNNTNDQDHKELLFKIKDDFANKKVVALPLPPSETIRQLRIGIVKTCWNVTLVNLLAEQSKSCLSKFGVVQKNITEITVPGSFELPLAAQRLATTGTVDAIIVFGVLIKGQTLHFDVVSQSVANGLMNVQLKTGVPVLYGVLNCVSFEQAVERCGVESELPSSLALSLINVAASNLSLSFSSTDVKVVPPCCYD
eukprot:CAMPEP_0174268462 /NCGR_PEP_ID=MMETSP0439-20130205/37563_1 /TAXON_ID=0 /ORGANISM="Stereomyxa ramosa, Strain Chinc5" /LENGTH=645 /DNA_ID=CAMNT_0015356659 /DNA_START=1 /DNA_END=1938 /DNA_ORIENTATION=+